MPSFEEMEDHKTNLRRGNLLWEGSRMMLPEHKAAIREHNEKEKRIEKHELDPDELQEIGYVVMDALKHTHNVVINYWDHWAYHDVVGMIANVSKDQKQIKLETDDGEFFYIEVDCLRSVVIL
ncbi:YolD-like family protein [Alkalicoccobacillus plakortidis]|uniref:YolD-like family protein n=1 Tax=Alkalicoccobacillus plakortidis TaxID=444060 RepID=A0ABT0XI47_9BACI|nr:YolD-like family protein [Alkalicoccobacillus plakortidis]MCM2675559.1 YolD-like family protein [Alkalicoccobacillus plakortidis]